jgi:membrane-associated phospholipid phosphatase
VRGKIVFYWLIGIVIAAIVMVAAFYFDESVRNFMAQHQNHATHNLMRKVSRFGDWPEHFALGLALAGFAWWRGNKKWTRIFLSMLIALSIAGVLGHGIKIATGRARPSVRAEEVWNRFSTKYHAFPSGHVAASTAFFGVLFFASRRIGLLCLPIPIVIGFSRMYVTAHYLSDVVCAAVLGILTALLVAHFLVRPIRNPQLKLGGSKQEQR